MTSPSHEQLGMIVQGFDEATKADLRRLAQHAEPHFVKQALATYCEAPAAAANLVLTDTDVEAVADSMIQRARQFAPRRQGMGR